MDNLENGRFLLDNEDLPKLGEFMEGAPIFDFFDEIETVAKAMRTCDVDIDGMRPKPRLLFVLRAFYLLGMLRGGESYREELLAEYELDDMEFRKCPFALDKGCADDAKDDLENMDPTEINSLFKLLGLGK